MGETANRILFGVLIGALVICALYFDFWHRILALGLILGGSFIGLNEFFRLTDRGYEGRPLRLVGYLGGLVLVLSLYSQYLVWSREPLGLVPSLLVAVFHPGSGTSTLAILGILLAALVVHLIVRPLDGTIYSVSVTVFGVLYTCLPLAFVFLFFSLEWGVFYLVYFVVASEMTDAGAYFAGRYFGRHNAGLQASPKKTYEGYAGGFIVAVAICLGFNYGWSEAVGRPTPFGTLELILLTLVVSFITIFGDLTESALKRDARIKDSASIIPGHGGLLDLIDALLFVLPMGYYYLHYKHVLGFAI